MNDGRLESLLRDAEPTLPRVLGDAAPVLAARVRERAAVRARGRRRMAGVLGTVGVLAISGVVAIALRADRSTPLPVGMNIAGAQDSLRLIVQRSEREAELASMVVRELRTQRDSGTGVRRLPKSDPLDVATVESDQAANVLLAQVRTFAEAPGLREAVQWRCELIIASFPSSAAAAEARAMLDSSGRSERSTSVVRRESDGARAILLSGASS